MRRKGIEDRSEEERRWKDGKRRKEDWEGKKGIIDPEEEEEEQKERTEDRSRRRGRGDRTEEEEEG